MNKQTLSVLLISAAVAFLVIFVYELIAVGIEFAYWWLMLFLACYIGFGYVKAQIREEEQAKENNLPAKKRNKAKKR
jgi:hypothetical protein